jgi:phage shock protein PspC (stress-responsive transcriptional regulator)
MERVVTIHLNGAAFQLEEPAYDALRKYLQQAQDALAENPDRAEIVSDLEQAIGDKCAAYLRPGKNVVTAPDMAKILEEMGPVDGAAGESEEPRAESAAGASFSQQGRPRRRLYRIKEGGQISGLSTGIAAYFDIDVTLVRVLWVLSALFSGGATILVYIVLMFVVPAAYTAEEWAAAHGAPFNAQEVIDEAKKRFRDFQESDGVKNWRKRMHERIHTPPPPRAAYAASHAAPAMAPPVGYATQVFAGIFAVIFGVVSAVLTVAFLIAIFSLATTGAFLGYAPPLALPLWLALIVLVILYSAVALPLRAVRRASYHTLGGRRHDRGWDDMGTLVMLFVLAWLAWTFVPGAREWMLHIRDWLAALFTQIQTEVRT